MRRRVAWALLMIVGASTPLAAQPGSGEPVAAVADPGESHALWANPAGLGTRWDREWRAGWRGDDGRAPAWWGVAAQGPWAVGFVRDPGRERVLSGAVATGGPALRLGWGVHRRTADGDRRPAVVDHSVGLLLRPEPWLSLGVRTDHVFEPRSGDESAPRTHHVGIGVRPLALDRARARDRGTRLTLTTEMRVREQPLRRVGHGVAALLEPVPGIALGVAWDDERRVQARITLRGVRSTVRAQLGHDEGGRREGEAIELALHPRAEERSVLALPRERRVATLRLGGRLVDEPDDAPALLGAGGGASAPAVHRALERALDDPLTRGLLLELQGVSGMAQIEELLPRLARLRAAGKPVVAWIPYGAGRGDLALASAADRIVASEEALFGALGLRVERRSYRAMLERFGVRVERASHGAFKSAYRELSADSVTDADREVIESLLDQQQAMFVTHVARARELQPEQLRQVLDGREWPAADLVALGVLDTLGDRRDALALLGRLSALGESPRTIGASRFAWARTAWREPVRIAVVHASGGMVAGRSGRDLLEGSVLGDQTLIAQLERAFRDRRVRAVVLRVDSPGGSGASAHLIDRAVQRLKRETGKPLVVSMAASAASAAYHISVHADWIVANRHTRTGSIGVFWLKPALEGVYEKLGVRQQDFDRGEAMRGWSLARRWTPAEQASADSSIRRMHDRFVATVAHGRRLAVADVDRVAQGRVWLGDDARTHGLVDAIGGLDDAVHEARRRAGIPAGERIAVLNFGRPRAGWVERLLSEALRSRLGTDLRLSSLSGPQARADLGALGEE